MAQQNETLGCAIVSAKFDFDENFAVLRTGVNQETTMERAVAYTSQIDPLVSQIVVNGKHSYIRNGGTWREMTSEEIGRSRYIPGMKDNERRLT